MSSNYDVGTRAWQPDATEGWVASEVIKKTVDGNKVTLVFKLENEQVRRIPAAASAHARRRVLTRHATCRRKPSRSRSRPWRKAATRYPL